MQRVLRLLLVVLLGSLTACHTGPTTTSRTPEASAQSTGKKTPPQVLSNKLEGHYEGIELDYHQDYGGSHAVTMDIEPTGTCLYSDTVAIKPLCHWERSTDRITIYVSEGDMTRPIQRGMLLFQRKDDKLSHLTHDGIGGGVCIQLVKNRAVADIRDSLCQGVMMGLPLPPK
jgi:hypothetical protein